VGTIRLTFDEKLAKEKYSEVSENIGRLKMVSPDGKKRETDIVLGHESVYSLQNQSRTTACLLFYAGLESCVQS
jgi:hypothetical protein